MRTRMSSSQPTQFVSVLSALRLRCAPHQYERRGVVPGFYRLQYERRGVVPGFYRLMYELPAFHTASEKSLGDKPGRKAWEISLGDKPGRKAWEISLGDKPGRKAWEISLGDKPGR